MRLLIFSIFWSEIPCGFSCFQYFGVKFHVVSCVFNFILSFNNSGSNHFNLKRGVIGRQSHSELYQESDNIDDMIENNDDYTVNKDSDYSGETSMDEQMLEDEENITTGEKE